MTKKIAIFGLGISGVSTAIFYAEKGYKTYVDDDRKESYKKLQEHEIIVKQNFKDWPWEEIEFLVLSPGISLNYPKPHQVVEHARKRSVNIICDIESVFLEKPDNCDLIAITGTNGKSTTTALINHILNFCGRKSKIGGNYGIPALSLDLKNSEFITLEISSYQLELLDKTIFDHSLLLNITPDHIDRHGNFENYVKAKERIFKGQNSNCNSIICTDQEITKEISQNINNQAKKIEYQTDNFSELKDIKFDNLPGMHNLQNIYGAYLICKNIGLEKEQIIEAIKAFKGLEHRIEKVVEENNYIAINDSKATNADATKPALNTFSNIVWLAGGVQKDGGIQELKNIFPKIKYGIFYGECRDEFAKCFSEQNKNFSIEKTLAEGIVRAKKFCKEHFKEKFTIVLSPACASFDEFKNFEERGKFFKEKILED